MVHKSLPVCVMVSSADLEGLNSKIDSYVDYFDVVLPTTHVEKGDGKSLDWIDGLKLPGAANILAQNTGLVLIIRSGSEGPSRDNVIGYAIVGVREVLCRATLTAYEGVVQIVPYRVVSPWGKPIGTLDVSFKFDDTVAAPSEEVVFAAACEFSKGFDEVARELSQSFDEAAREPVTKYPAPAGASMGHAEYTTAAYARYAPAGYALYPAVPGHALPPAVYPGFASPPQQQVNKKNNFRAKLRAMLIGVSSFAHLASAVTVMGADVDPGTDAAGFGSDDGGLPGF